MTRNGLASETSEGIFRRIRQTTLAVWLLGALFGGAAIAFHDHLRRVALDLNSALVAASVVLPLLFALAAYWILSRRLIPTVEERVRRLKEAADAGPPPL